MGQIGAPEIILIILAIVLLFGAKKLPELARGSGRALRIFKAETKGLVDNDDKDEERQQIEAHRSTEPARSPDQPVEQHVETEHTTRDTER